MNPSSPVQQRCGDDSKERHSSQKYGVGYQSTTTERSRTNKTKVCPPNMERRGEKRLILVLMMSNTFCLSKLRSGPRRDAMLSIVNKHASRMPLDNLSGLHATKHKLLWQGQQRKFPLICNQELKLFPSRKYFFLANRMSLQSEMNSEAVQALSTSLVNKLTQSRASAKCFETEASSR